MDANKRGSGGVSVLMGCARHARLLLVIAGVWKRGMALYFRSYHCRGFRFDSWTRESLDGELRLEGKVWTGDLYIQH